MDLKIIKYSDLKKIDHNKIQYDHQNRRSSSAEYAALPYECED